MAPFAVHPWILFFAGLLLGTWCGATIGSAGVLLLAGRRMKQLETINRLLRIKLQGHARRHRPLPRPALASVLRPFRAVTETAALPIDRIASGN